MNRGGRGRGRGGQQHRRGPKEGRSVMHRTGEMDEGSSPSSQGCFGGMRRGFLVSRGGRGGGSSLAQRMGLPMGRGGHNRKNHDKGWRKVVVPRGRSFGKEWLLRELEEHIDEPIYPVHFKFDGPNVTFLVDDLDKVESIRSVSRRFEHPGTGNKVIVNVEKAEPPFIELPPYEEAKIREALARRFDGSRGHLDLSQMSLDTELKFEEINCSLQRNNYMMTVAKLVGQNCPGVVSIDASGNRLRFMDYFATLIYRARNVLRLNLSNNQIERPSELDKLKGWPIVELELDGNPLCNAFNDVTSYTNAVHSVFPKVTRLDGVAVEAAAEMGFGLDEEKVVGGRPAKRLPPPLPGFTVNAETKTQLETFMVEYMSLYDDADPHAARQKLGPAYDEAATFSLVMEGFVPGSPRYGDTGLFQEYRHNSHNVAVKERWENHRTKVVAQGNILVLAKLCSLPKTKHLLDSFVLDVALLNPPLVVFNLQGLFWDGAEAEAAQRGQSPEDEDQIRFFSRSFVVTPRGAGLVILNDSLTISSAGRDARARYVSNFNAALATAEAAAAAAAAPTAATLPQALPSQPLPGQVPGAAPAESREAMVARFAAASGMKPDWAQKCLLDNAWDFDKAAHMFTQCKDQLPKDAFA